MSACHRLPVTFAFTWGRCLGLLLLISGSLLPTAAAAAERPNIVWIVAENFSLEFGCYGAQQVHTPHVDQLAAEGLRFDRVYATSPVCAPSRSAFMTGMYQTSTDTHNMRSHRDDDFRLPAGVRPLTQRLRDAGYMTANLRQLGEQTVGTGKLDLNFVNEGELYQTEDWSQLAAHQPFFAQINTPEAEYDIYDRQSASKSRVPWVGEEWHPAVATAENVELPPYYPEHPIARQEWARYLNSASGVDVRVGWILAELKRAGLADNTIVVFFADNGRMEPRGIHWCTRSGLHVPLIIRWPRNFPAPAEVQLGGVDQRVVSLLDITATTLAWAGVPRPIGMQSRALFGPDRDPPRQYAFSARDRIDETVIRQRSVYDGRYHYIRTYTAGASFSSLNRYKEKCFLVQPLIRELAEAGTVDRVVGEFLKPFPGEMLYDTQADEWEIDNLAASVQPSHQSALLRLRAALDTWIVESGDRGHWPESAEVVAPFEQEMHNWFGTPAWHRPPADTKK